MSSLLNVNKDKTTLVSRIPHPSSIKALVTAVAMAFFVGNVYATPYVENGKFGDSSSWESQEYKSDWGLSKVGASLAYGLGFNGKGVKVGVVDSGAAVEHIDLNGERWHEVVNTGEYSSDGQRYPKGDGQDTTNPTGEFHQGEHYDVPGHWVKGMSDLHGTHVSGTVAANRNGIGMHGVAWGSEIYLGNTGGSDSMVYETNQDYGYFHTLYEGMAQRGVRVINQSWGSPDGATVNDLMTEVTGGFAKHLLKEKTFITAAVDVAKAHPDLIFVWTNGNQPNKNPYNRGIAPAFIDGIEGQWLTVGAATVDGKLIDWSGRPGSYAKWWGITAPGVDVNSTFVDKNGIVKDEAGPKYKKESGTSMAAPYATGALAVVMSRYPYMSATQARDVLLTTATKTLGGEDFLDVPTDELGWGFLNLKQAMYGPKQLLKTASIDIKDLDVWSHNISTKALTERSKESDPFKSFANKRAVKSLETKAKAGTLSKTEKERYAGIMAFKGVYAERHKDAESFQAGIEKLGKGTLILSGKNTYSGGTVIKEGQLYGFAYSFGDAVDASNKSGKVIVEGGTFGITPAFVDQITLKGRVKSPDIDRGYASVEVGSKGTLAVLISKEELDASSAQPTKLHSLKLLPGATVHLTSIDWKKDAPEVADLRNVAPSSIGLQNKKYVLDLVKHVSNSTEEGYKIEAKVLTTQPIEGDVKSLQKGDYLKAKEELIIDGNSLVVRLLKKSPQQIKETLSKLNLTNIGLSAYRQIGDVLNLDSMALTDVKASVESISSESIVNYQTGSALNLIDLGESGLSRVLSTNRVVSKHGLDVWADGVGTWGQIDIAQQQTNYRSQALRFGVDKEVSDGLLLGAFVGIDHGRYTSGTQGNVNTKAGYFGIRAIKDFGKLDLSGVAVMGHHRDHMDRHLVMGEHSSSATIKNGQGLSGVFTRLTYKSDVSERVSLNPYIGFDWVHLNNIAFADHINNIDIRTTVKSRDLVVSSLGLRVNLPFELATRKLNLSMDGSWKHYWNDKSVEYDVNVMGKNAHLVSKAVSNGANLSVDLQASLGKDSIVNLSYNGTFSTGIRTNGVVLKVTHKF